MKKFKSVDGSVKRIALLSGHVFIIGNEWKTVPSHAESACFAAGCVSEEVAKGVKGSLEDPLKLHAAKGELTKLKLKGYLKTEWKIREEKSFTTLGEPKYAVFAKLMKENFTATMLKACWKEVRVELRINKK